MLNLLPIIEDVDNGPYVPGLTNTNAQDHSIAGHLIDGRYQFVKQIGLGSYGLIYLVEDLWNGNNYACKIVLNTKDVRSKDVDAYKQYLKNTVYDEFDHGDIQFRPIDLNEINEREKKKEKHFQEILTHLKVHRHPNVATIHKVFDVEFGIIILMEYFSQGDLFHNIVDKNIFEDNPIMMKNCILQLVQAMNFLRRNNVYHCDLKPENILVRYNPDYKRDPSDLSIIDYNELTIALTDFGLALQEEYICCNSCRGSGYYMAPERIVNFNTSEIIKSCFTIRNCRYLKHDGSHSDLYLPTLPGDIWSLGIIMINITCGRNPWTNSSITNEDNEVFTTYMFEDNTILEQILPISKEFNQLLNNIFQLNPDDRINLFQLYYDVSKVEFFTNNETISDASSSESSLDLVSSESDSSISDYEETYK